MDEETLRSLRHDLRSPLVVIAGFAQLLMRDGPLSDADRKDYAARILTASEELETMIDERL